MLRKTTYLLVGMMLLTVVPAMAGKIGFVEVERAAATTKQGQQAIMEFEAWVKPRRERIAQLKAIVDKAAKRYVKEQGVASEAVLEKLQNDGLRAKRNYEDAARQFNREAEAKRNQLLNEVAGRMKKVINDYAVANGYDAVLVFKPKTIIYLSSSSDLTDTIIRLYDERFPAKPLRSTTTLPGLEKKRKKR